MGIFFFLKKQKQKNPLLTYLIVDIFVLDFVKQLYHRIVEIFYIINI